MAQIAGIVLALAGAYEKRRGAAKAERAQNEAVELQKHYDKQAIRTLGDEKIFGASEWLFPGLLAPPLRGKGGQSVFGEGKGVSPAHGQRGAQTRDPWGYLGSQGMADTGTTPATSTTPPTHGGIDPTATPIAGASGAVANPLDTASGGMEPPTYQSLGLQHAVGAKPAPTGGGDSGGFLDKMSGAHSKYDIGSNAVSGALGKVGIGGSDRAANEEDRLAEIHSHNVRAKKKRLGLGKFAKNAGEAGPLSGSSATDYPGQLIMNHLTDLLKNPGQLSSTTYERDQEQANQGLNAAVAQSTGQLTGLGVDPRSGLGQVSMENAVLNFGKERNEAARDYSLAQEELKRQDIQAGIEDYLSFLSTVFGLQQSRADAKGKRKAGQKAAGTENAVGGQILQDAGHSMMGGGMGGGSGTGGGGIPGIGG